MKSFFEEYGFVILVAIIVILLIVMATPVGDLIKIQIDNTINSFGSKTQSKLNATDGIINIRASTANNKITLEWDANKKEDKFKYQYKASNTKGEANWTNKANVTADEKSRTVTIEKDSNDQPLANKTKVEYKIYDSNDQLVASGVVNAKVGKSIDGGSGGTGGDPDGGSTGEISGVTTGTKLTIKGKEYTVIEQVEGNKYKVLANELANNGSTMMFGNDNNYATSSIATYLDGEYYNSLPETIRNAIVETSIQQKNINRKVEINGSWSVMYSGTKTASTHKVFLPSWNEATKVYGRSREDLKNFPNSSYTWLRDSYASSNVLFVDNNGNLCNDSPHDSDYVRPAFVLDLSKVEYIIK